MNTANRLPIQSHNQPGTFVWNMKPCQQQTQGWAAVRIKGSIEIHIGSVSGKITSNHVRKVFFLCMYLYVFNAEQQTGYFQTITHILLASFAIGSWANSTNCTGMAKIFCMPSRSKLVFYGTFSTNRLYHATKIGNVSHMAGVEQKYHAIKQWKNTINQHNHKLSSAWAYGNDPLAMVRLPQRGLSSQSLSK